MHYNSYSHESHRRSVVSSLVSRAFKLCSDDYLNDELDKIQDDLILNGYPKYVIKREIKKQRDKVTQSNMIGNVDIGSNVAVLPRFKYISTPYIRGTSERVQRAFKPFGVKLSNKPSNLVKSKLSKLKDNTPLLDKANVVYKISCQDCSNIYIGETGRQLATRLKEHQKDIRDKRLLSHVASHSLMNNHRFDFNSSQVLHQCNSVGSRKLLEAYYTHNTNDTINRALDISVQFRPIVSYNAQ